MKYISSDTNVWIDFHVINCLDYPFRLPYTYLMNEDAIKDELLTPINLSKKLLHLGLSETSLTIEEFFLAEEYINKYPKPSKYDCIALAIAKNRNITLLTGDKALRKAAEIEGVKVIGTLGILEDLYTNKYISNKEYLDILLKFQSENNGKVRLPSSILEKRIKEIENILNEK